MSTIHDSYLGVAAESVYGTAVAVSRFFEMPSESFKGAYERIDSAAFRAGQRVLHKDRYQVNPKGASGDVELEVLDKTFGLLLQHALGGVSTGAEVDGLYPHTVTLGTLVGESLTVQAGRVSNGGVLHPSTYSGGKVKSWTLSNAVDGVLKLKLSMDFAAETIGAGSGAFAAHTPAYSAGQLFTFNSGSVTIAGTAFEVSDVSFEGDNGLKIDRWSLGATKREPLEQGLRSLKFSVKGEFESLTHINRVASATNAGALAAVVAEWTSPQGGKLTVTLPQARFDEGAATYSGNQIIGLDMSGIGTWDGTAAPITVVYLTSDATP